MRRVGLCASTVVSANTCPSRYTEDTKEKIVKGCLFLVFFFGLESMSAGNIATDLQASISFILPYFHARSTMTRVAGRLQGGGTA